nr:MAG TPA: hypothetical protein [Caudoviricetes sp.]
MLDGSQRCGLFFACNNASIKIKIFLACMVTQ